MCASRLKSLISANRQEGRLIWIQGPKVNSPHQSPPENQPEGQPRKPTHKPPGIVNGQVPTLPVEAHTSNMSVT